MPSALMVLGGGSSVPRQVCGPPSGGDLCTQSTGAMSEGGWSAATPTVAAPLRDQKSPEPHLLSFLFLTKDVALL